MSHSIDLRKSISSIDFMVNGPPPSRKEREVRPTAACLLVATLLVLGAKSADAVTVFGTVQYEKRSYTSSSWSSIVNRPSRYVTIEILDSSSGLLATTFTSSSGFFSVSVPALPSGAAFKVRVRAETAAADAAWACTFSYASTSSIPVSPIVTRTGSCPSTNRSLNMIDAVINGYQYADGLAASTPSQVEIIYPNGTWPTYDQTLNNINIPTADWADVDDALLHEYGHFLNDIYTLFILIPGGEHGLCANASSADLAFSEGWATYIAGASQGREWVKITGTTNGVGNMSLENAWLFNGACSGPHSTLNEMMVSAILWDTKDAANESHDAISGKELVTWNVMDISFNSWVVQPDIEDFYSEWPTANELNSVMCEYVNLHCGGTTTSTSTTTTSVSSTSSSTTTIGGCSDDTFETVGSGSTDDTCWGAEIGVGASQNHLHCDEDWVYFNATAGATYRIQTSDLLGGADTTLALHLNCGGELAFDDDGGGGLASLIDWTAQQAGAHDIRVREFNDSYVNGEGYTVTVSCIANCGGSTTTTTTTSTTTTVSTTTTTVTTTSTSTTTTLPTTTSTVATTSTVGGCSDDTFETQGSGGTDDICWGASMSVGSSQVHLHCDEDWVYFEAIAGATYRIETLSLIGGADTTLALHYNCGSQLAFDDDGGGGLASLIEWTASQSGPHDVRVREFNDSYVNGEGYTVRVTCLANCNAIFSDSFESGDTSAWSATVP